MLAEVRLDQKNFAAAETLALQADQMYAKLVGARHNYRTFALIHLGKARLGKGDAKGALEAFNEALELRREAFGEKHRDTANALWNLGGAEIDLGDPAAGEKHLREAIDIYSGVLPAGHVAIPRARVRLVQALLEQKRYEEADTEAQTSQAEFLRAHDTIEADRQTLRELAARIAAQRRPGAGGDVHWARSAGRRRRGRCATICRACLIPPDARCPSAACC
jgi:tetratricopeptide (TPR) repeat protein